MIQLKVKDLKKDYQNGKLLSKVLKGITFSISDGEFISICGPSGSGKTTLLYVLSGLEPYTSGAVSMLNKELSTYADKEKARLRSQDIGFVFQFYNLIPNLTVYENILLAAVLGKQASKKEVFRILDIVRMKEFARFYPSQLSGGMQQRIAIARCLINDPKIIFADEPIGNLDYKSGLEIMDLFKRLNTEQNKTILMVTHNEDTTSYGTRTLRMLDGKVISDEVVSH